MAPKVLLAVAGVAFALAKAEFAAVEPHAVHDHRQLAGDSHGGVLVTAAFCDEHTRAFSPDCFPSLVKRTCAAS